jgi:UDP-N-acetylmuramate dehydrogenase
VEPPPIDQKLRGELQTLLGPKVRFEEPMHLHTSFHIGGPAQVWAEPADPQVLLLLVGLARRNGLPVTPVGGGANLLVDDAGIPGLVIHPVGPGFQGLTRTESGLRVGAGVSIEKLIRATLRENLSGAEFLAGVPGRMGGAVRMNAGTHDEQGTIHSISDVAETITTVGAEGQIQTLSNRQADFRYRSSGLAGQIVTEALLSLSPDDPLAIERRVKTLWALKRRTQDWTAPSAGCIFKNPAPGTPPAGWMIDRAGLKGFRIGGAMVSPIHANFMVNCGNAKARDVFALIDEASGRVEKMFQVRLELEVQVLPVNGRFHDSQA